MMIDGNLNEFQNNVAEVLIRHKSLLDIITKFQESCSKVNRAVIKSASGCGCIEISGKFQAVPSTISYNEVQQFLSNHVSGELCDTCRDKVEEELGSHLFYMVAICSTLGLDLNEVLNRQLKSIKTLGKYSLY